jgi:hypothetical protein
MRGTDQRACRTCRHFDQRASAVESLLPGLAALSSAYASVRAGDGVCTLQDRYAADSSVCDLHSHAFSESVARFQPRDYTLKEPC